MDENLAPQNPEYAAQPSQNEAQNSDYFANKMSEDEELAEKHKLEELLESEYSVGDKLADIGFYIVSAAIGIIVVYSAWTFLIKQYFYDREDVDYDQVPLTEKKSGNDEDGSDSEERDEWS